MNSNNNNNNNNNNNSASLHGIKTQNIIIIIITAMKTSNLTENIQSSATNTVTIGRGAKFQVSAHSRTRSTTALLAL
jgi:hypothetical protein